MINNGIKELYVADSIEELNKLYRIDLNLIKTVSIRGLCNSAKTVLDEANKYRLEGDEEKSYVLHMKFLNLMAEMRKKPNFRTEKDFVNKMIGTQATMEKIYELIAVTLKSLKERYALKANSINVETSQIPKKITIVQADIESPAQEVRHRINSKELYEIITSDNTQKILIMDCRPIEDFQSSQIIYQFTLNVPSDILQVGMSASKIQNQLPNGSKIFWELRKSRPIIIFVDWFSTRLERNSPLWHLKEILMEWDPDVEKKPEMLILEGGYREFLTRYPTRCTDPHVKIPSQETNGVEPSFEDIEYPNLEDIEMKDQSLAMDKTMKAPQVNRSMKANAIKAHSLASLKEETEKIMNKSLQNEMELLDVEKDFKKIKDSDLSGETGQQEQALMFKMWELQSKDKDIVIEEEKIKKNVQEYKEKDVKNASEMGKVAEIERILLEKKLEKQRIQEEREKQKKVREEALKQARQNKPSTLTKPQLKDELVLAVDKLIPSFDRSSKPLPQANRFAAYQEEDTQHFDACEGKVERGLTGLKNLGNTCYMNSIIQCLSNTSALTQCLLDRRQYERHINYNNKTKGRIVKTLASLIKMLWSGECKYISSKKLRSEIGQQEQLFSGYEQQDSHEFLIMLIDWLQSDLQTIPTLMNTDQPSEKAWLEFTKAKESLILHMFYGQIKSTVKCTVCEKESATYETFSNLSLELPSNSNHCDIEDCFNLYFHGERVPGWNCPKCKVPRDAIKKLDISKLPPILVIHFKRFLSNADRSYEKCTFRKNSCLVNFPLSEMEMMPYVARSEKKSPSNSKHIYNLYAVSNHYGTMESGHYTAFCKNSQQHRWFKFDDDRVSSLDRSDVKSSAAYILFYTALPEVSFSARL